MSPLESFDCIIDSVIDVAPTSKLVLLALLRHANEKHQCWPSQKTIASKTGLTRRTVIVAVAELVAKGHLAIVDHKDVRGGRLNVYQVKISHQVKQSNQVQNSHRVKILPRPGENSSPDQVKILHTKVHREGAQEGAHISAPASRRKKSVRPSKGLKKTKLASHPRHQEVASHWIESVKRERGIAKPTFEKKEGALIRQLLVKVDADEAIACITNAFADPFWKGKVTLASIVGEPDRFRTRITNSNGRHLQSAVGAEDWESQ